MLLEGLIGTDEIDAAAEIGEHVRGRGRRHMARAIGRRCHHRPAEGAQKLLRNQMLRQPYRNAVESGGGEGGDRAIRGFRQNQRQWPRPERRGEPLRGGVEPSQFARRRGARHMRDQGIEGGAAFGGIKPCNRLAVAGVGAEPVDGLGRERDQPAGGQYARGFGNAGIAGNDETSRQFGSCCGFSRCHRGYDCGCQRLNSMGAAATGLPHSPPACRAKIA